MEILQLPMMALQERIDAEMQSNPVLEMREPGVDDQVAPDRDDETEDRGERPLVVDQTDPKALAEGLAAKPRLVWIETPSNPLLRITDIATVTQLAHDVGALVVLKFRPGQFVLRGEPLASVVPASAGPRLEIRLPSSTTSWSINSAPAFLISWTRDFQPVILRPPRTWAVMSNCGP